MKATLIVLAVLISAGLVAGIVAPPSAEVPAPAYSRYDAVTRIQIGTLPTSDAGAATASDGAAIPLIDVFGAGVLVTTVGATAMILRASRRSPSVLRAGR